MSDLLSCAGRRALVIGGGTGIGFASAQALSEAGAAVFLSGRRGDRLEAAAGLLRGKGEIGWKAGDARHAPEVAKVVACAAERLGGIDTLVVSAGTSDVASIFTVTPERFDAVMAANLNPLYLSAHYAASHMKESRRGSVIAIASAYGVIGQPERIAYSAAKAGIVGMVRSMALDFAPFGVCVNAISPGVIETELFYETLQREADPEAMLAHRRGMHPIGRTGRPEEIAAAVVLLASNGGGFITGWTEG
jgi:NAD(P)-dependent dehydrogenase (short-subunit alcohol dehydrogenase family)